MQRFNGLCFNLPSQQLRDPRIATDLLDIYVIHHSSLKSSIIILEWNPRAVRLCRRRIYPTESHPSVRRSHDSRLYALSPTASAHPNFYTYVSGLLPNLCALSSTEVYRPPYTLYVVGECQSSACRALYSTRALYQLRELRNAHVYTSVPNIGVSISKCALACGRNVIADLRGNGFHGKLRSYRRLCWGLWDD